MTRDTQHQRGSVRVRDGHDNFFTPLRLIFALLVMVGHAFVVSAGDAEAEPFVFLHYTFSYLAVNLFFVASGLLVTKSMLSRGDIPAFIAARALRIMPALVGLLVFILLIVGTFMTSLPLREYLTHPDVLKQPLYVMSFFQTDMVLPGVFDNIGEPYAAAPLWTLRLEVMCYIATLLLFSMGLLRRKWMALAQFIVPSVFWIVGQSLGVFETLPATIENLARFGIAYGLGATFYAYRERLQFHWLAIPAFAAISWVLRGTPAVEITVNLMLAAFVIWAAYVRVPKLNWLQRKTDLSYGIYIYHWVVLQVLISLMPGTSALSLFLMGLPIVVTLAWLSWNFIESPMLRHKTRFGEWLRFGRQPRLYDNEAMLLD